MSRSADYTIQGFIYQFNKTLLEILEGNDDTEVAIEGIIEDIEVTSTNGLEAIQCKYHEGEDKDKSFTLGQIFKPVLQMMDHFYTNHPTNIRYKLFVYFPNKPEVEIMKLDVNDVKTMLSSKDKELQKYIFKIDHQNYEDFLDVFSIEFGESLEFLINQVENELVNNGFSHNDIDILIYPNALQLIADMSICHDVEQRRIKKIEFLNILKGIKTTAVTRWTLALRNYKKILETRRKQLKFNLTINSRLRYFIMSDVSIVDFNESVVNFIKDFLDKYHYKPYLHNKTPIFCLECTNEQFDDIKIRLYKKGVRFIDGYITQEYFDEEGFFKEPIISGKQRSTSVEVEFRVRLLHYSKLTIINKRKCDDLFIISSKNYSELDLKDIVVERIELNRIEEIKYILGMRDTYE